MLYNSKLTLKDYISTVIEALPESLQKSRFIFDNNDIYYSLINGTSMPVKSAIHMMARDLSLSAFELYQIICNNKEFGDLLIDRVELYAIMDDDDDMITEHIITEKDNINVNLHGQVHLYYRNGKGYMKSKEMRGLFKIYLKNKTIVKQTENKDAVIEEIFKEAQYKLGEPYVSVMGYNDWSIFQSSKNRNSYLVIDPDRSSEAIYLECIAKEWITDAEYHDAHTKYDNDYFGEFDILELDAPGTREAILEGKHCVGWFKIIKE